MKLRLTTFALAAGLSALPVTGQDTPPPAPPVPPPAAPAPGAPGAPELLPPPAGTPAAEVPDNFKSEKDRQSYAVGWLFASREKNSAASAGSVPPVSDEVLAGMKDVLAGGKSLDYAVGAMLAMQIRRAEVEVDMEVLSSAVRDALAGNPSQLTPAQQQAVLQRVQEGVRSRLEIRKKAETEKVLLASNDYLTANAKNEGVKSTASGLQYKIEKEGEGKTATEADIVTMNQRATLTDGTEFEKQANPGPLRRPFRALPKGLQEGLGLIKAGGKAKFWVPPALGYGETGRPPYVKAHQVLVYEIEVVAVEPLPKPPANANTPAKTPITAVTPPITVEIPPKPADALKPAPAPAPAPPPAPEK